MRLDDQVTVGERIAYYRRRQGMTQEVLCGLVGGRTTEWLRQIENGHRDSVRNRESAMLRYDGMAGLIGVPIWQPTSLEDLRARVERAFFCSQTERWSEMGPFVPDMIADAWHFVRGASTEEERREAYALQALVYRVASGMLDRLGETRLPWVAAERSMFAAEQTGDPLLIAGGAWRMAVVLRHAGRLREATDVPIAAADALRSSLTSPQAHSVYGSLMLKGAVGAATLGDRREAEQYLTEAARSAEIIRDRNDYWFAFGPTNIAIHRVWLSLEMGDPGSAIDQAAHVPHNQLPRELAERQASHLITVAWAHYLRRRDRDALKVVP